MNLVTNAAREAEVSIVASPPPHFFFFFRLDSYEVVIYAL